jgi:hypothetical protein
MIHVETVDLSPRRDSADASEKVNFSVKVMLLNDGRSPLPCDDDLAGHVGMD